MQSNNFQDKASDEIVWSELLNVLQLSRKFIFKLTGVFTVLSIVLSLLLTNIYTSEALLIPTSSNANNPISQYSDLASVAGISIDDNNPDVTTAIAYIKSKKIISHLMKYESFLPDLMAAKKWDKKSNSIIYHEDIYDSINNKWIRDVDFPFKQIPSELEAFEFFSDLITISEDPQTQLITLSVDHISPSVAQQWALWLIEEANLMVANMRIEEAESSIKYLNDQIKLTPYAELRTMFFNLIQKNTQNMMLAKVNKQYALTIIDPPLIPEIESKPIRPLIIILGTLLGGFLSISIILARKYLFGKDEEIDIFKRLQW
ncbi:Wzz/FepE/Etk N-terminal domain-containing protein [Gammaproteobacteria bacterium]|nr:Wzz/FepE/Etk N-terminal domain-containing protein [Gammaproteobacteria bacterium]